MSEPALGPPPEGWEAFFETHVDSLLRAAAGILRNSTSRGSDAEDVVSRVLTRLIARGLPAGNSLAYVITSVRNAAVDELRKLRFHSDTDVDPNRLVGEDDIESEVDAGLLIDDVLDALDQLPDKEATAIRGKFLEERPWQDVARDVGVSTSHGVAKIVNRGLATIRKMPRFAGLVQPNTVNPSRATGTQSGTTS